MSKDENRARIKNLHGNLKVFKHEFIGAGPRTSVIGLYRKLLELGAIPGNKDKATSLITSKQNVVVLCVNDGVKSSFARVSLFERTWWDYWHNAKRKHTKPAYKTYNASKQLVDIVENLDIKEYPLLIPE